MIIGHLLTKDGLPDVLRAVESLYPVCDEIVVVDNYSTDGTWELLKDRAKIYNLRLCQSSATTIKTLRNFLLTGTPQKSWIVTIDQDESMSPALRQQLRGIIQSIQVPQDHEFPFVIKVPYFTLINDIQHYSKGDYIEIGSKVFYVDGDIEWRNKYHCEPSYPNQEGKVDGLMITDLQQCIFHHAWLDPKRLAKRFGKEYEKYYIPEQWDYSTKEILPLPEGVIV